MKKENLRPLSSHEHSLEKEVHLKIKRLNLENSITFFSALRKIEKSILLKKLS